MTGVFSAVFLAAALPVVEVDLNAGWTRVVGQDSQVVDLPDDFNINMPWCEAAGGNRGFKSVTNGVYRRQFMADACWRGKRVFLDLDGVQSVCDVSLNGSRVASWDYGSLGFETELTDRIDWTGSNEIEVRCMTGGEKSCRWYAGCGITRGAKIVVRDRLAFARHGIRIVTSNLSVRRADVDVSVEVSGLKKDDLPATVFVRVLSPDGRQVGSASCGLSLVDAGERSLPTIHIESPALWDVDSPRLYRLCAELVREGEVADRVERRFGIRSIAFSKDFGFRLNGRKVFLKGVAGHQHLGALGEASHVRAWRRQLAVLKTFGFNAVRCAHNPYPEEFLDLCDEMGFLVVDELVDKWRGWWAGRRPFFDQASVLVDEWVRRDRNHPSVILWSLGNETQFPNQLPLGDGLHGVSEYRKLDRMVRKSDDTRPTTVAMFPARAGDLMRGSPGFWDDPKPPELACVTDVASFNYVPGDYASYRRHVPHLIVFQSEAAVKALTRAYYLMDYATSVGLCYWGAIAYWGESDGWPKKGWDYSFFDRKLDPFPQAWLVRSAFRTADEEPVVRIGVETGAPVGRHWNDVEVGTLQLESIWNFSDGSERKVLAFSNGDEVELVLNGRSLGRRRNGVADPEKRNVFEWTSVCYEPGRLEAISRRSGNVVARHQIETTGPVAGIEVVLENEKDWVADGQDLQYVWIRAVDAAGRLVRGAQGEVKVSVSGVATLRAVDDGDSHTDARFDTGTARFYRGSALAILRSTSHAGKVCLEVVSPGLGSRRVELMTRGKHGK